MGCESISALFLAASRSAEGLSWRKFNIIVVLKSDIQRCFCCLFLTNVFSKIIAREPQSGRDFKPRAVSHDPLLCLVTFTYVVIKIPYQFKLPVSFKKLNDFVKLS